MEYKDRFYLYTYCQKYFRFKPHAFRFRFDPVAGTGAWRNTQRLSIRHPRTTYEKKWSYAHKEYTRARRYGHNLPESWDDRQRADDKNRGWKRSNKKRQWMMKGDKLYAKID